MKTPRLLLVSFACCVSLVCAADKPRVVVLTDIENEPDDTMSMVRFVTYANNFEIEGRTVSRGEMNPVISRTTIGPDFFRTLGIPLLKGRYFTQHDNDQSKPVAIVSEGFVRRFLPHE